MAKDSTEAKPTLKLIHLMWMIMAAVATAGATWGITIKQQEVNTKNIEKKVEKDIFTQHIDHQKQQFDNMNKNIEKGFGDIKEQIKGLKE
jgi:hypothetical protein